MTFQKTLATSLTVAAISYFATPGRLAAAAPVITYTASGTFASTPTTGADTLKLAGEPFTVSIAVSASTTPSKTGKNWAVYTKLKLNGSVHSGLLGPTPVTIASGGASIEQLLNPGQYDSFVMGAPIKVVGLNLTITATIAMPSGTITKPLLHPFNAVAMGPGNASVTYSDGTSSTTIPIQSGSLTATIPAAAVTALNLAPVSAPGFRSVDALTPKVYVWG